MDTSLVGLTRSARTRTDIRVKSVLDRACATAVFVATTRTYWSEVWPFLRTEIKRWRVLATAIPDESLRRAALQALHSKRGNLEGAVAFAAITTRTDRLTSARAMAAYQAAFDYLDSLCEMPHADPIANGEQLNRALLVAVRPDTTHADYYAHHSAQDDAGYLQTLIDSCRQSLIQLPAFGSVNDLLLHASHRAATYQSLNHGDSSGSHTAFDQWAIAETARFQTRDEAPPLYWWEIGAAGGSSLAVLALMGAAADARTSGIEAAELEHAYYPWIGAVNSLLDSLIDQDEDDSPGQHRLLDYYPSFEHAGERLELICGEALRRAQALTPSHGHVLILAAMKGLYLSSIQAHQREVHELRKRLRQAAGPFETMAGYVMRTRQMANRLARSEAYYPGKLCSAPL